MAAAAQYGLPWAFPGWVGKGSGSPFQNPDLTASYLTKWVEGAKTEYNLDIDYGMAGDGFKARPRLERCGGR